MVAIEGIHLNVSHQHPLVFPTLAFETHVQVFADKASTPVCGRHVLCGDLVFVAVAEKCGR